ncbi:MAG: CvpA family protein, partial [Kiritimatiellae bacterium]|nr:CvpA family protein [Kiritimatiellia bacterium]
LASLLDRVTAGLSAGDWVDLLCLAVLLTCMVLGGVRGLSGLLSSFIGLLVAISCGGLLYGPVAGAMRQADYCREHPWAGRVMPYVVAVVVCLIAYLMLRLLLVRFFKLIVEQPAERILGIVAGLAQGLLMLGLAFSLASLLPAESALSKAFCENSRVGRRAVPWLRETLHAGDSTAAERTPPPAASPSEPARPPAAKKKTADGAHKT